MVTRWNWNVISLLHELLSLNSVWNVKIKTFKKSLGAVYCVAGGSDSALPRKFVLTPNAIHVLREWRPSVRPSVCNVGGLWSLSATTIGNRHMVGWVGVVATCMRKVTLIVVFCNPNSTEKDQWGRENVEFCASATIINAISASAELLVTHAT